MTDLVEARRLIEQGKARKALAQRRLRQLGATTNPDTLSGEFVEGHRKTIAEADRVIAENEAIVRRYSANDNP